MHLVTAAYVGSATVKRSHASKRLTVKCPGRHGACESLLADPRPAPARRCYPGRKLTIVAMNDRPLGRRRRLAPTAVLSTGQSLVVRTKATTGRRPGYVDANGGSKGARYQLLLSFRLPRDVAPGIVHDSRHGATTPTATRISGTGRSTWLANPQRCRTRSLEASPRRSLGRRAVADQLSFSNPNTGAGQRIVRRRGSEDHGEDLLRCPPRRRPHVSRATAPTLPLPSSPAPTRL